MITILLTYAIASATVYTLVALGGMLSERSGIINIGLEGIMGIGAVAGAIALAMLYGTMPVWLLLIVIMLVAMIAGGIFSLLLAVASIHFKANQTIAGVALNIISLSLAMLIVRMYNGDTRTTISYVTADLAFSLFGVTINYMTIVCVVLVVLVWVFVYKTRTGMRLMACGEHPQAADSVGVNVYKMRYIGVVLSGILGGLGGLVFVVTSGNTWNFTVGVNGAGFLALAVMIFGQWKPIKIALAAILFGIFRGLALVYTMIPFLANLFPNASYIWTCVPYIVCLVVLALTSKSSRAPKAEGVIYDKGQR